MPSHAVIRPNEWTVADLFDRFGPIPFRRISHSPAPGTATEADVLAVYQRERRLCELVDGVLVEKAMGVQESFVAVLLARLLGNHAAAHGLGFVLGADGMTRLAPGLVRIPDVSFVSWNQVPTRRVPRLPMLQIAPDLAVEILSPSNTAQEMEAKLRDYFTAGVRLVWYVDPENRTVQVFTAVDQATLFDENQPLDGGVVLPGFTLPIRDLFADLE